MFSRPPMTNDDPRRLLFREFTPIMASSCYTLDRPTAGSTNIPKVEITSGQERHTANEKIIPSLGHRDCQWHRVQAIEAYVYQRSSRPEIIIPPQQQARPSYRIPKSDKPLDH